MLLPCDVCQIGSLCPLWIWFCGSWGVGGSCELRLVFLDLILEFDRGV